MFSLDVHYVKLVVINIYILLLVYYFYTNDTKLDIQCHVCLFNHTLYP